jgi:hypothetical protein
MKTSYSLLPLLTIVLCVGVAPGVLLAAEDAAPQPDEDGWYSLFNGKDLTGWKVSEDNPDTFQVVNGEIVAHGPRAHLFYAGPLENANFTNFEWKCEIMTKPHSNSGMYFHTEYQADDWPQKGIEIQVNNSYDPDPRKTGSVYAIKDVMNNSPAKDNEWFTQHVIVDGRKVTVKVNDKVVNEWEQPESGRALRRLRDRRISSGTFALQGHDPESEVHYRKVLVKPLP